jgi:hypothetical protein
MARPITSLAGGASAWLDDGRILFQAASGELYELPVTARGDELDVGEPRLTFGGRKVFSVAPGGSAITRDGKRLLAIVPENGAGGPPLVVVQHGLEAGGR